MRKALALAAKGRGYVNPNPMVGAVIVKNDRIIAQGYHEKYGEFHAERNAINNCKEPPKDAAIYVTLEPCCHTGKTPPCTDAIIESGIKDVFIGTVDPNEKVAGKGIEILRKAGLSVETGILESECKSLNSVFFHYIKTGLPYVTMKYAMTMDGKIATTTGASKWITGEAAREHVHAQRSYNKGIMVGLGTVIGDDPMLTSRTDKGSELNPTRIICDTNLDIPMTSKVVETAGDYPTVIATASEDSDKIKELSNAGCRIITVEKKGRHIDFFKLMKDLGEENIDSIYLEGGAKLNWEMLKAGLVNKINAYIALKIFGGSTAPSPVGGEGVSFPDESIRLINRNIVDLDGDILIESEVVVCSQE